MSPRRLGLVMGVVVVGVACVVASIVPLVDALGWRVLLNVAGLIAGVLAVAGAIVGIDVTGGDG